mmetsp:Transcript_50469/g.96412  ORF Transcript_50469/g.96412 Transcript_50469/m.96412 type:complete len:287 (+) Transcript_50469:658-1518(+)
MAKALCEPFGIEVCVQKIHFRHHGQEVVVRHSNTSCSVESHGGGSTLNRPKPEAFEERCLVLLDDSQGLRFQVGNHEGVCSRARQPHFFFHEVVKTISNRGAVLNYKVRGANQRLGEKKQVDGSRAHVRRAHCFWGGALPVQLRGCHVFVRVKESSVQLLDLCLLTVEHNLPSQMLWLAEQLLVPERSHHEACRPLEIVREQLNGVEVLLVDVKAFGLLGKRWAVHGVAPLLGDLGCRASSQSRGPSRRKPLRCLHLHLRGGVHRPVDGGYGQLAAEHFAVPQAHP